VVKQLNMSGPLAGKIDVANIGFMGHSMGGGGTLIAANKVGNMIQAAIPTQPYAPGGRFPDITCPTLIIAAENDNVATVASNALPHYTSIPNTTKRSSWRARAGITTSPPTNSKTTSRSTRATPSRS
jgi:fermentation-respiration switch protein FrsA (DUF1100 family)